MANEENKTKSATKNTSSSTKKTTGSTTKKATPKKSSTTSKKTSSSSTKKTSSSIKKPTSAKTQESSKIDSKDVKNVKKPSKTASKAVKTEKKTKPKGRLKSNDELTAMEEIQSKVEGTVIREKVKKGKTFYLLFSILVFIAAFFYINNVLYDNSDLLQSALFAFAVVFIVFVLLLFNVHMMILGFFILPFKTLWMQSKKEFQNKVEDDPEKSKLGNFLNKRKATFSILIYSLISGLIIYSVISDAITDQDKVLSVITQAIAAEAVFLLIVCSWQYLFNIIPTILDKSIDAKNGFILTLSAIVMIIYLSFMIFEITRFAEMMIFVLIIGFIALLGVNLNLIVGEINIFQNLREKKSKAVTRIVFIIFFGFHLYVILYASVVAFSIYNWDHESYIFGNDVYDKVFYEDAYDDNGDKITTLYDQLGNEINAVYDISSSEIIEWYDGDGEPIHHIDVYNQLGTSYSTFYNSQRVRITNPTTKEGILMDEWFYHDGTISGYALIPIEKTYGDFLYYAVVTISSVGYGDIYPSVQHNVAQAWGGFLSIYGLTFYALSIGFVSNIAMEGITRNREED